MKEKWKESQSYYAEATESYIVVRTEEGPRTRRRRSLFKKSTSITNLDQVK